ncbi:MAG: TraB/GumN family protein [Chitinophagaceae bacterium]|nr:TraB/GumN family protein [Chitinophagaceae bacterium]
MSLLSVYLISEAQTKKIKPADPNNTLLWEVSGRGLKEPSYLYGTMHMVCEEDAKMSDGLKEAIHKSKQIYFELDMDNMEEMMSALKYARMTNGLKLSDLVSPDDYQKLENYFRENKVMFPFAMLSRFKPYFISAFISEGLLTCQKKVSIEQQIMAEAKQYDKEVNGLETMEFQASIFDSIPYEKQAQDLVMYVDSIDKYKKATVQMADMYRRQEINDMDSLTEEADPGMAQYMGVLLYDRNRRWADQIPEQMFQMSTLFAVGAGHLGGEKGLLALLKKQGFAVKPLDNTKFTTTPAAKVKAATL